MSAHGRRMIGDQVLTRPNELKDQLSLVTIDVREAGGDRETSTQDDPMI